MFIVKKVPSKIEIINSQSLFKFDNVLLLDSYIETDCESSGYIVQSLGRLECFDHINTYVLRVQHSFLRVLCTLYCN